MSRLWILVALIACATPLHAQTTPIESPPARATQLFGKITDAAGGPAAGAMVIVTQRGRELARVQANLKGIYSLPVPASEPNCEVIIWLGATSMATKDVVLTSGAKQELNFNWSHSRRLPGRWWTRRARRSSRSWCNC